jgi:exonuclease III
MPKLLTGNVLVIQVKCSILCFYFSIYHHPSTSKSPFLNEFQSFIGFLSINSSPFIITGDFDIHMDNDSLYAGKFKHACDLLQHMKQPTHIHGHIIDLFITTPENPVSNVGIGECLSDHFFYFIIHQFSGDT